MQKQQDIWQPAQMEWKQTLFFPRSRLSILVVIIVGAVLLHSLLIPSRGTLIPTTFRQTVAVKTIATNGANHWSGDRNITAPTFDFSPPDIQNINVSSLFEHYYSSHGGASSLGTPVTAALPIQQGWIQFFEDGALLLPSAQGESPTLVGDSLKELIDAATTDPASGIMQLSLLQALLTVGSQAPIGGDGSHFTYVDLRNATNPALMVPAPTLNRLGPSSIIWSQAVFIKAGIRAGKDVGHLVPLPFWRYINRTDISPDGWEKDFGDPLTEALPVSVVKNGSVHHLLIQAFWHGGLVLDQDTMDASGQPKIQLLDTGVAYLRTFGPPAVSIRAQQTIWAQGETALFNVPDTGQPVVHVGQAFPLILLGDTTWNAGMFWYHVQWNGPEGTSTGWVAASAISFTLPKNVPAQASFDLLSPDLATYLASIGSNVNAVVYDVTHRRYYTYNANAQFITGSSMKVAIMLTFLNMMESQGREPDDDEMNLLTTMIENSDNDSASALYYGEIGGAAGVASYLQSIGVSGLDPNGDAWGYSLITPMAMVNLLTLLYEGKILTQQDRELALYLMENIEPDQQVGVGDTAPPDATVAMKDGWLPGPDGLWAFNSSGIVTLGRETYIIAVYTQEQDSLDDGHAIVRHVCAAVASSLILGGELKSS
jgi:beta-lactamase class A